jgi:hypothetical protein
MRTFQQILEAAGYETSAYSGRGMQGRECLGVDLPAGADRDLGRMLAEVIGAMGPGENDIVAGAFRRMRTDALGCGSVVYFPGIHHS